MLEMERSDGLKGLLENSPSTRNSKTFLFRNYVLHIGEIKRLILSPKFASVPRWEDLNNDILALIFNKLDVIDLTMGASRVCISWFLASHNKTLWNTVDLAKLQQIDISYAPVFFYKHPVDNEGLSLKNLLIKSILYFLNLSELEEGNISFKNILTVCTKFGLMDLEKGNISLSDLLTEITKLSSTVPKNLIFNFRSCILEGDLEYAAERMPNIEKLVLPVWLFKTENSFLFAFSRWKNLKTLIMAHAHYITWEFEFHTVGENCGNLTNLKYLGHLTNYIAHQIVLYFKNLKRLSLRRSSVSSTGVLSLITGLPNLAVLNLSHCQDLAEPGGGPVPIDNLVQAATQKLDKFIICSQNNCMICKDQHRRGFSFTDCSKDWQNDEIKEFEF